MASGGRVQAAAVLLCGLLVAAANGAGYGMGGNHPVYLIPGLRLADPAFLAADWWATQTTHYHVAFAWLVGGLARLGLLPWALVALNWAAIVASVWAVWRLLLALAWPRPLVTTLLALALFFGLYGTRTPGEVSLIGYGLEPAMIANAALLYALLRAVRQRHLAAGLLLAGACAFHVQIGVLGLLLLGAVHLVGGRDGFWRRGLALLAPGTVAVLVQLPLIARTAGLDLAPAVRAEAAAVFFAALPQHYRPLTWIESCIDPLAWALIALPFLDSLAATKAGRTFAALLAALLALIAIYLALTTLVFVEGVSRLFVARLSPFLVLFCQVAAAAVLARALLDRDWRIGDLWFRLACAWAGLVLLVARPGYSALQDYPSLKPLLDVGWVGYGALLSAGLLRPGWRLDSAAGRRALGAAAALLLLGFLVLGGFRAGSYDTVSTAAAAEPDEALYRWAATTPADAVFVIPPDMARFRLRAGRAVVAELKALPFRPDEMLAWKRRLDDLAGDARSAAMDFAGLPLHDFYVARYAAAVPARLDALARDYGADYLVWRQADGDPGLGRPPAFANRRYAVYALGG